MGGGGGEAGTSGPFGESSGGTSPIAVENFRMLHARQTTGALTDPADKEARVNLLNWDGKGSPQGLFPRRSGSRGSPPAEPVDGTDPNAGSEPKL